MHGNPPGQSLREQEYLERILQQCQHNGGPPLIKPTLSVQPTHSILWRCTTVFHHRHHLACLHFGNAERTAELMDQPHLGESEHFALLKGLARLNWWSGSTAILWPWIKAAALAARRRLRVLDVATGGGDVPIRLWHRAQRAGLDVELVGCDRSERALEFARRQADRARASVRFFHWDILQGPPPERFDVVISSLFLHHLEEDQAVQVLRRPCTHSRRPGADRRFAAVEVGLVSGPNRLPSVDFIARRAF